MRRLLRILALTLCAVLLGACARGPDEAGLAQDVQSRLDALFGRQVLVLETLNRQGSAPYSAAADGGSQAIVYYNAVLEFAEAYDPSDWEGLGPQAIASALGASDAGILGFGAGSMAPGAQLQAYGSLVYRRDGDQWRATDLQSDWMPAGRPAPGARSRADELIVRLARVTDASPRTVVATDRIVAEELDRALQRIELRLDTGAARVVVATGPEGGEYARFVASLQRRLTRPESLAVATTAGSVANAFMVDRGTARFGLVQSDVAAAAVAGEGPFGVTGPLRRLRAVASLFPEPVHVLVRGDSGIGGIAELAGRRLSLGPGGSGTRHTAVEVLAAHGLSAADYVEVPSASPREALEQLERGAVDAVVEVVAAPWGQLSQLLARMPGRLLPLEPAAIERISSQLPGMIPLAIAARSYPGQAESVSTVAATALLVVNSETPDAIVADALARLYEASASPGRGVRGARLARDRALVGVTIPLHDGALRHLERASKAEPHSIDTIDE